MDSNSNHAHAVAPEWSMYAGSDFSDHINVSPIQGKEALAKATKDLMSLDADRWNPNQLHQQDNSNEKNYEYFPHPQQQYGRPEGQQQQQHHHRQSSRYPNYPQPRRNVTFPFLAKQEQRFPSSCPPLHHAQSNLQPISIAPLNTLGHDLRSSSSTQSAVSSSTPTTASSSSNSSYTLARSTRIPSPPSPLPPFRDSASPPGLPAPKRHSEFTSMPISKRARLSPPESSRASASPPIPVPTPPSHKPALLSPSQKKANHIQSEQKRRANIRRGYEALCETVPALREAIRLEEEQEGAYENKLGRAKRGKGRGKTDESAGDKIDGRAGPRSENVVLIKSKSGLCRRLSGH